jgi:cyclohexyl-isocyanide hydratase
MASLTIGLVLFPQLTQLDLTGPLEVFSRMPGARPLLVAATTDAVASERGLRLLPDVTFDTAPPVDVLFVPGGPGVGAAMEDERLLAYVAREGARARWITSVCTGALILGAAGLLRGRRATTHWLSLSLLEPFGAILARERVVVDGNCVTGGGVTAGIDFALHLAATVYGPRVAQAIQLLLEYDPSPPFSAGSPTTAPADLVDELVSARRDLQRQRAASVARAAARLRARGDRPG